MANDKFGKLVVVTLDSIGCGMWGIHIPGHGAIWRPYVTRL